MSARARIDLKLEQDEKQLIAHAADLMGTSMAGFLRVAGKEKAQEIMERETRITVSRQDFLALMSALDKPFAPNPALQQALEESRRSVRRA